MAGSGAFLNLPPEVRVRVYESALKFEHPLQRALRASAWRDFKGYVANVSLLTVSKLIHREAKDVFYEVNKFRVSYNHMCTCQNRYPYTALDERVREVEVYSFLPRVDEPQTCTFCSHSGFGIIDHLMHLKKLESASIAFEDIFSFSDFAPELLRKLSLIQKIELASEEVGMVQIKGLSLRLEILLPSLHRAWSFLAEQRRGVYRLPGEKTMRRALEYLQFEANTYDRTARALLPFFIATGDIRMKTLRFKSLPDENKRRAEFTLALVGVLSVIFEDDGGAASIDWTEIGGGMHGGTWRFSEGEEVRRRPDPILQQMLDNGDVSGYINTEPETRHADMELLSDEE